MYRSSESNVENVQIDLDEIMNTITADDSEVVAGPSDILIRLNDDCIMEVFDYLPLDDLCNVAGVCRAFESNALSVFKRKYEGRVELDFDELSDGSYIIVESDSDDSNAEWKSIEYTPVRKSAHLTHMAAVRKLFFHFGAHIKAIELTGDGEYEPRTTEIFELMSTYCAHEHAKLTKLTMNCVRIAPDLIPLCQSVFDRLTFLDIIGGSFPQCLIGPELTELSLNDAYVVGDFTRESTKLHTLTMARVGIHECKLLERCTHLKRLSVKVSTASILKHLPLQLEELELGYIIMEDDLNELAKLRNVKVLTLKCNGRTDAKLFKQFVEQNVPLEELHLKYLTLTEETATNLAGLSKLKTLSLYYGGWEDNVRLSNIIKGLSVLEQLYLTNFGRVTIDVIKSTIENAPKLKNFAVKFKGGFSLKTSDFFVICALIRKRSDRRKLLLELSGSDIIMNVPKKVIERNSSLLEVTVITFVDVKPVGI